ncbi:MAG: ROK family protein [Erysipelotrichaceae bacterium]|nr:ROK family protein [Erysipelotrichaceae bacterium]
MNVLCFDVGGTSVKYGLLNESGEILEKDSFPARTGSMEAFLSSIKEVYDKYAGRFEGVSFSMPGVIDPDTGYFISGGAYDGFMHGINMKEVFSSFIKEDLVITNDAKCAAYGELGYGCLKDVNDAAVIVLGTGIGGCLIKDRKPLYGAHLLAGEFSFINTTSQSGFEGAFAKRCGVAGLLNRVKEELQDGKEYSGREIFAMANEGNEKVLNALRRFCFDLAVQILNIQVIFDPEVFAIGGGISQQKILFELIDEQFQKIKEARGQLFFRIPDVVACAFRNDANLIGALYRFVSEHQ